MQPLLLDRKNYWALHFRWSVACAIAVCGSGGWYACAARATHRLPGGSSVTGWTFGVLAGLIILFECLIWTRKTRWFRTRRFLGSAQLWMKAHIWLGLLTVPLVFMHCGFQFGGQFTTILTWVFAIVIASGVFGLVLQNVVPRLLLEHVPGETIYSQIRLVASQYAEEAERIVSLTCGTGQGDHRSVARVTSQTRGTAQLIGAPRRVGAIPARSPDGNVDFPPVESAQALRDAFERIIRPFLENGRCVEGRLTNRRRSQAYFHGLRAFVTAEARPAVDAVERLCDRRRDLDLQRRLHFLLHGWLLVHLPLSMALLLLLVLHVVYAIRISLW